MWQGSGCMDGQAIRRKLQVSMLALAWMAIPATLKAQEIAVKNNEKIAFLGDSITQQGAGSASGYVRLVIRGLDANGIRAEAIPAGIGGHKSNDMLARLERDVISKKPEWMTLSCGVNDVWHGANGVPLDKYKANITQIVEKAQAANIKVVILTSTMIGEDQPNDNNQKLIPYNDFLKSLAAEKRLPVADLNAAMQTEVAVPHKGTLLTTDGVHMNPLGNQMMAAGVLKAFGLNEAQLQKARDAWATIPQGIGGNITLGQFNKLNELAMKQNRSVNELLNETLTKAIDDLLK